MAMAMLIAMVMTVLMLFSFSLLMFLLFLLACPGKAGRALFVRFAGLTELPCISAPRVTIPRRRGGLRSCCGAV